MRTLPFFSLLLITFSLAGLEKLFGFQVPTWFLDQFHNSLLDIVPGMLEVSFGLITFLELTTSALLLIGIAKREFLQSSATQQIFLKYGVLLAQITFVALGFGQRLTHKYEAAATLFFYAILTFIASHIALARDEK
ncbi:MAG: hypothetical protein JNL11_07535 [Bdellovibrionaceae bacterium]|nr:hypothetical protein [Pseudobdellovibrionaceae bacterium]